MSEFVIEMKGVTKIFPGVKALDNVDLSVKPGEIHALLGENGAGKSTLMNCLVGQYTMDEGQIQMDGKPLKISSAQEANANHIVIVPQELNLLPDASIAENIFLGNERVKGGKINWKEAEREAAKLLKVLDLELDVTQKVKTLSAAYQQLVSIARALAYSPRVLVLDEPTAVLTSKEADSLFKSMQRLKAEGTSMIFITHHLDEVMSQADRATIMRDGQLVMVTEIKDITKEEIVTNMAGKKVAESQHVNRTYSDEIFFKAENLSRDGEFQNVSFDVKKGEILAVAGLVGAGRTEVFKSVFGITRPNAGGKMLIEGKEVNISDPGVAIKYGMGYVSEERRHDGITPGMSVMENMILPSFDQLKSHGLINYKKAADLTDKYIDRFRIKTPGRDALIKNLSGGNQQKVIVARWMAKGIKMLIMDEPTRGIDVNAKAEIHALCRELADNGVAVVVISSEMEEVLALGDRVMIMHQGRVKGFIDDVELTTEEDVLQLAFK
ncbi:ribose transport system ATP-binding protein [Hespellia stercorisuis DSM 15480]|uniref:Ribose transport system ATP-binding protein n=1 Tax=Hespellia stercorisuis DSM 15480 TaxID=1121950 RepID=A0A1M6J6V0_9FIRM|nr:sugar ABC transporter ATP-binding protein [Hespellia stercorisuis]SHJ42401.1 ribose transport system ATP-binding protein [Hespellia stercorisuis DSM 15480]